VSPTTSRDAEHALERVWRRWMVPVVTLPAEVAS